MMNISQNQPVLFGFFAYEGDLNLVFDNRHWMEWIWHIFWLLWIEVIGNGCLFATFVYERFGMDPQKRTVINQLLSQLSWIIIFSNITIYPMISARRFVFFILQGDCFKTGFIEYSSRLLISRGKSLLESWGYHFSF